MVKRKRKRIPRSAKNSQETSPPRPIGAPSTMQTSSQSRLLTIPAELRVRIFELAFSEDAQGQIELLQAKPPSRSALLTCRLINKEANAIYHAAYRRYWTSNDFLLSIKDEENLLFEDDTSTTGSDVYAALAKYRAQDLRHIRSLTLTSTGQVGLTDGPVTVDYVMLEDGWRRVVKRSCSSHSTGYAFLQIREEPDGRREMGGDTGDTLEECISARERLEAIPGVRKQRKVSLRGQIWYICGNWEWE